MAFPNISIQEQQSSHGNIAENPTCTTRSPKGFTYQHMHKSSECEKTCESWLHQESRK